jgi:hypothetical protein
MLPANRKIGGEMCLFITSRLASGQLSLLAFRLAL